MKNLKISLIILFSFFVNSLWSQDISKYLNDGGVSDKNNLLKIAYDPINGELPVVFEHSFKKKMSFEVGAGPVWIEKQNLLFPEDPLPIKQTGMGFTCWIKQKMYFNNFPERFFVGYGPKFTIMDKKLFTDAIIANIGYQRLIYNRLTIGADINFAFRFYRIMELTGIDTYTPATETHFQIPVYFYIGYLL